jgi:hypothetical protein
MFHHQDIGQNNNINIPKKSFEMAQQNSYTWGMTVTNQ